MKRYIFLMLFILCACQNKESASPLVIIEPDYVAGLGIDGFSQFCPANSSDEICTFEFGPGDQFGEDCTAAGYVAHFCGCHEFICWGPDFTGRDVNGDLRTCQASSQATCTTDITPADQFALDCKTAGNLPVACGCHDFICVEVN